MLAPSLLAEEKLLLGQTYQDHGLVFYQASGKLIDPRNFPRWELEKKAVAKLNAALTGRH